MLKKTAWCVTDGAQGTVSQVKGLAQSLSQAMADSTPNASANSIELTYEIKTVVVRFPWKILPIGYFPVIDFAIKNNEIFNAAPPDYLITCGRKSIYLSINLKKKIKK